MSEVRRVVKPCPVCACAVEVQVDPATGDVALAAVDVPPLYREKAAVVAAYKKAKGLALASRWDDEHRARALACAGDLIVKTGAVEHALDAMAWFAASAAGRRWDLEHVVAAAPAFLAARAAAARPGQTCWYCRKQAVPGGELCVEHAFCAGCEAPLLSGKSSGLPDSLPRCGSCANVAQAPASSPLLESGQEFS